MLSIYGKLLEHGQVNKKNNRLIEEDTLLVTTKINTRFTLSVDDPRRQ